MLLEMLLDPIPRVFLCTTGARLERGMPSTCPKFHDPWVSVSAYPAVLDLRLEADKRMRFRERVRANVMLAVWSMIFRRCLASLHRASQIEAH